MARSTPEPRVCRLSDLEPGQVGDVFVLLVARKRGETREGKPFYRVQFRDRARTVTVMIWSDGGWFEDCDRVWQPGQFYKVRGRYYENQYGSQLELERIRPVEAGDATAGFDPAEFIRASRFDPEAMLTELISLAREQIPDLFLRELVLGLLDQHAEVLPQMAAAMYHHHAYRGGFLEHVLSVTRTAVYLADKYSAAYPEMNPPLNKSLVVAGAILHDIGKTQELRSEPLGTDYTPAGRLIGHLVLGRDLVRAQAATMTTCDAELLLRLEHILLSHQGLPEWGSPIPPSTPEALIVHMADDLDAKFEMMAGALSAEPVAGEQEFTSRDNPLKRRIFRGLAERE